MAGGWGVASLYLLLGIGRGWGREGGGRGGGGGWGGAVVCRGVLLMLRRVQVVVGSRGIRSMRVLGFLI